jgi:hypothetical protein
MGTRTRGTPASAPHLASVVATYCKRNVTDWPYLAQGAAPMTQGPTGAATAAVGDLAKMVARLNQPPGGE